MNWLKLWFRSRVALVSMTLKAEKELARYKLRTEAALAAQLKKHEAATKEAKRESNKRSREITDKHEAANTVLLAELNSANRQRDAVLDTLDRFAWIARRDAVEAKTHAEAYRKA